MEIKLLMNNLPGKIKSKLKINTNEQITVHLHDAIVVNRLQEDELVISCLMF